ncbi:hypothetical protein CVT24_011826 [Panaeolus cyanescens]|uniref:Uncharacterized protein n=1 Tax=Panaeolus cyanescens TaxID=181874 RepID=A0A409YP88_9AGAR|nr:hypothetical protein CVT24_011826 [Panaeolus cyanescens]
MWSSQKLLVTSTVAFFSLVGASPNPVPQGGLTLRCADGICSSPMPVTFNVSPTKPNAKPPNDELQSHNQILDTVWGQRTRGKYQELLQSTFSAGSHQMFDINIQTPNGFIDTVIDAYNSHHNLVIRPDDVWISILSQFNFYVNAHGEELRSKFVAHEGKKTLVVKEVGTRYSVDFGKLAHAFTQAIQENVVDPDLQSWILPNFSTTDFNDTVVCSMMMMSTLKTYFNYFIDLKCGIPSITLQGTKEDWQKLLDRVEKFESFGDEPAAWASLLRSVLTPFVDAFDGNFHPEFWPKICHHVDYGSGSPRLSGWITNFCVWNNEGKWMGPRLPLAEPGWRWDNSEYTRHTVSTDRLPPAICEVDVKLDDNGQLFDCIMVAGHVGSKTTGVSRDTLELVPAWFMAIKNPTTSREFSYRSPTALMLSNLKRKIKKRFKLARHSDSVDSVQPPAAVSRSPPQLPVTFNVSPTTPNAKPPNDGITSHEQILNTVWGERTNGKYQELLQSTFSAGSPEQFSDINVEAPNGFIDSVIDAYNNHHNLVIRPDDIWISILSQFNFYVNAHGEELRSKFVAHGGKKTLVVQAAGTRYAVDFGQLAHTFTDAIQQNVLDPELQKWILPDFSTTTSNDTVVYSMMMMSTLKTYFDYYICLTCGIPNVTLMGTKEDWQKLLNRIDKFASFGDEPAAWESLLRSVLTPFVDAFDGNFHPEFWPKICHYEDFGSGSPFLSGWITNFCVWDKEGKWIGPRLPLAEPGWSSESQSARHSVPTDSLPPAICEVDVKLNDNGELFDCIMVAGHVGSKTIGAARDTLELVPAWFMAIKNDS